MARRSFVLEIPTWGHSRFLLCRRTLSAASNKTTATPPQAPRFSRVGFTRNPDETFLCLQKTRQEHGAWNTKDVTEALRVLATQQKLEVRLHPMFRELTEQLGKMAPKLDKHEVRVAIWALDKLGARAHTSAAILDALQHVAALRCATMTPVDLSTTLSSLSSLRTDPSPKLIEAASLRALSVASRFPPRAIANTMWAFAQWKLSPSSELYSALSQSALAQQDTFTTVALTNFFLASIKCNCDISSELLAMIEAQLAVKAPQFNFLDIQDTLLGYSLLSRPPPDNLTHAIIERLPHTTFSGDQFSFLLLNMARARYATEEQFITLTSLAIPFVSQLSAASIARYLLAFDAMGLHHSTKYELTRLLSKQTGRLRIPLKKRSGDFVSVVEAWALFPDFPSELKNILSLASLEVELAEEERTRLSLLLQHSQKHK